MIHLNNRPTQLNYYCSYYFKCDTSKFSKYQFQKVVMHSELYNYLVNAPWWHFITILCAGLFWYYSKEAVKVSVNNYSQK